ncbi:hypothetical protein KJY73_02780 [Bowmanella sp. Y26]|uniref:hypothetical protein n=1 Tax=Bowmanella yangjiangensis TaxID=2811230 RepID=UPI001BDDA592|nr:hypothetical protein [Bowmanella yangjiangensis]MBT1062478.1 hypothetical protein [Bowmanella yangjiangensis]
MGLPTANIGKNGYNFGQGGYASYGRIQLPGMASASRSKGADISPAANFRKGILFYFGRLQIAADLQGAAQSGLQGVNEAAKVVKSIQEAQRQDWGRNPDAVVTVHSALKETLKNVDAKAPSWLKEAGLQAVNEINLDGFAKGLLSTLGDLGVPVLGDVKKFATNFASGVQKAWLVTSTKNINTVLRSGSPTLIIESIHGQLTQDAAKAFAASAYSLTSAILGTVTSGVSNIFTSVTEAVANFIAYILDQYRNYRDRFALTAFFADCKNKFNSNDNVIFSQQAFLAWFTPRLDTLPIVASHCISSSVTGSYFGFLTALGPDGNDVDTNALQKGYVSFGKLKAAGREYAKRYPIKFSSDDELVSSCLTIINKGGIDKTDGAAAKSVGWFRRMMMKTGLQKNTLYA